MNVKTRRKRTFQVTTRHTIHCFCKASDQTPLCKINRTNIKTSYKFRKTMVPHILWGLESGTQSCRPLVESLSRKSARVCKQCTTEQTGNCKLHDRTFTSSAGDAHCCGAGPCKHDRVRWSLTERNKEKWQGTRLFTVV
jgi:hypothetical protein